MEKLSSPKSAVIGGVLAVVLVVGAFWVMAISPKREEVSKLESQVEQAQGSLAQHRSEIATAQAARRQFPEQYQRLVVLGKAVPGNDETASLLVQLTRIADNAHVRFANLALSSEGGGGTVETSTPEAGAAEGASPTEVAASTLPLGATVGPAGLGVMPYTLTFTGSFFHVADFIHGLDSLVSTGGFDVRVDGRLLTINGFSLQADPKAGFPQLEATFSVTTYLTPPEEGLAGGASPEEAATSEGTLTAATTGEVAR